MRRRSTHDSAPTETFYTFVNLLPGTHHFKYIVDDQIRLTNDYPRAVDDRDGTLANYVAVTAPSGTGSPNQAASVSPVTSTAHPSNPNHSNSFWSDSSTTAGGTTGKGKEAEWTTDIPLELVAAAAEEEAYLARADSPTSSASGIPAPNIPPAPVLPRHLDKLILNVRPVMAGPALGGAPSTSSERDKRRSGREKERSRRDRDRARDGDSRTRPANLGMTSAELQAAALEESAGRANGAPPPPLNLPVTTASGTDLTAALLPLQAAGPPTPPATQTKPWDGPGVSDDASVLPVPSHVVLHHLSTSAIRNGVLAVANTTRYRKKVSTPSTTPPWSRTSFDIDGVLTAMRLEQYITTIYYKPT
ncbi:hypothetical protein TRAPUB_8264 [Trametes pubescens]|uniref:Association with the SNF1 complex (ASC) domain-containing protein n=1 Tax=Trametes pubescens TaxID=154538 RepID=A0A1M2W5Z0_TRAPU|nr:hypothetical protein TRAPUB_8264 [Trametes pubescens]